MIYAARQLPILLLSLLVLWTYPSSAEPVATVCIDCHGKLPGRPGEPVKLWQGSVHAANGVSCHGCHGGDPADAAMAMSPERGFLGAPKEESVPVFCGRCHVGVKEDYLASAHGRALGRGGPNCVTCHGNHAVRIASRDLINRRDCTRCHDYGRAGEIKETVEGTDRRIAGLERKLADLRRVGIATSEMKGELFDLRNRFHRLFHSVDADKVRNRTAGFREELDRIEGRAAGIEEELDRRKLWGGGVVALLACGAVVAYLIYGSYQRER